MAKRRILLAHADTRAGLAVARSLARNGFEPIAAVVQPKSMVTYSKVFPSSRCRVVPSPSRKPQEFCLRVINEAQQCNCVGIMPITDQALSALISVRESWPKDLHFIGPDFHSAVNVLDKNENLSLARELGVPCPINIQLTEQGDIRRAAQEHPFPWVFKRPDKHEREESSVSDFDLWYVADEAEAAGKFALLKKSGILPVVQEFFAGRIHNLCCFHAEDKLLAAHQYVSLRRSSCAGILREIIEPYPLCLEFSRRILQALKWKGVAQVQFIVNETTGETRYLETNGRFWASTQGSINAGWDFPAWAAHYSLDGIIPEPGPLSVGSKTCYHTDDLMALLEYFRGGPSPTTNQVPTRLQAFASYLSGFGPGIHSDVFSWRDPLPSLIDHGQFIYGKTRNLLARMSRFNKGDLC